MSNSTGGNNNGNHRHYLINRNLSPAAQAQAQAQLLLREVCQMSSFRPDPAAAHHIFALAQTVVLIGYRSGLRCAYLFTHRISLPLAQERLRRSMLELELQEFGSYLWAMVDFAKTQGLWQRPGDGKPRPVAEIMLCSPSLLVPTGTELRGNGPEPHAKTDSRAIVARSALVKIGIDCENRFSSTGRPEVVEVMMPAACSLGKRWKRRQMSGGEATRRGSARGVARGAARGTTDS